MKHFVLILTQSNFLFYSQIVRRAHFLLTRSHASPWRERKYRRKFWWCGNHQATKHHTRSEIHHSRHQRAGLAIQFYWYGNCNRTQMSAVCCEMPADNAPSTLTNQILTTLAMDSSISWNKTSFKPLKIKWLFCFVLASRWFLFGLFFYHENRGDIFPWKEVEFQWTTRRYIIEDRILLLTAIMPVKNISFFQEIHSANNSITSRTIISIRGIIITEMLVNIHCSSVFRKFINYLCLAYLTALPLSQIL
jgi:hypothetical protein